MSRFSEVMSNVILRDPKHVYGRIYVVSAYAGVTDMLLEHKKSGKPGVYTAFAYRRVSFESIRQEREHSTSLAQLLEHRKEAEVELQAPAKA